MKSTCILVAGRVACCTSCRCHTWSQASLRSQIFLEHQIHWTRRSSCWYWWRREDSALLHQRRQRWRRIQLWQKWTWQGKAEGRRSFKQGPGARSFIVVGMMDLSVVPQETCFGFRHGPINSNKRFASGASISFAFLRQLTIFFIPFYFFLCQISTVTKFGNSQRILRFLSVKHLPGPVGGWRSDL